MITTKRIVTCDVCKHEEEMEDFSEKDTISYLTTKGWLELWLGAKVSKLLCSSCKAKIHAFLAVMASSDVELEEQRQEVRSTPVGVDASITRLVKAARRWLEASNDDESDDACEELTQAALNINPAIYQAVEQGTEPTQCNYVDSAASHEAAPVEGNKHGGDSSERAGNGERAHPGKRSTTAQGADDAQGGTAKQVPPPSGVEIIRRVTRERDALAKQLTAARKAQDIVAKGWSCQLQEEHDALAKRVEELEAELNQPIEPGDHVCDKHRLPMKQRHHCAACWVEAHFTINQGQADAPVEGDGSLTWLATAAMEWQACNCATHECDDVCQHSYDLTSAVASLSPAVRQAVENGRALVLASADDVDDAWEAIRDAGLDDGRVTVLSWSKLTALADAWEADAKHLRAESAEEASITGSLAMKGEANRLRACARELRAVVGGVLSKKKEGK